MTSKACLLEFMPRDGVQHPKQYTHGPLLLIYAQEQENK